MRSHDPSLQRLREQSRDRGPRAPAGWRLRRRWVCGGSSHDRLSTTTFVDVNTKVFVEGTEGCGGNGLTGGTEKRRTNGRLLTCSVSSGALRSFYEDLDRKSTRLNSSHLGISYAVFCLKKKKI